MQKLRHEAGGVHRTVANGGSLFCGIPDAQPHGCGGDGRRAAVNMQVLEFIGCGQGMDFVVQDRHEVLHVRGFEELQAAVLHVRNAPPAERKPIYKRAWFWGAVAGGAVVLGVVIGVSAAYGGKTKDPTPSIGTWTY